MWRAVAALDPGAARDLAAYFGSIQPKPACYACHGVGVRDIPRLGGLSFFYLKARLEQWGPDYHSGAGTPMPVAARQLGPAEIEALASYLSFVN